MISGASASRGRSRGGAPSVYSVGQQTVQSSHISAMGPAISLELLETKPVDDASNEGEPVMFV